MLCTSEEVSRFREQIWTYYRKHGRSFPWRETDNPYHIFVSEIMLQQTQTDRVLGKYGPFLDEFPTFKALAEAPLSRVLALWSGLGYNRRALGLKRSAEIIHRTYRDSLPCETEELLRLPMIGPATAGSLQAFVFNLPSVFIETNIRRVIIHHFFSDCEEIRDRDVMEYVEAVLDRNEPRGWYYAMMDYGVYLKRAVPNPNRRSAAYHRQAPFENSDRQIRGALLKLLVRHGSLPVEDVYAALEIYEKSRVERCLQTLECEGFIAAENQVYRIV